MRRGSDLDRQQGCLFFNLPDCPLANHALTRSVPGDAASETSGSDASNAMTSNGRGVINGTILTIFLNLHKCSSQNPLLCFHFLTLPATQQRPDTGSSPETQLLRFGLLVGRASPLPSPGAATGLHLPRGGGVSLKNMLVCKPHQLD